ncbi:MAG: S-layer homology domain-containing protein [Butyricicoccus pullicaecorum]|nr:S-layer homology domain-containing protein [Butyricicoccus pullicaecorum]
MKKRILAAALAATLAFGAQPFALAANDIHGHWAEKYITYLHQEGVINPSATTGNYTPGAKVTRAEFMRYINRAFHFTETTDISFTDVNPNDWFYETVQIATKYGYIAGIGDNKMNPEGYVTREQAAAIIGRLYKTTTADKVKPAQLSFTDKAKISDWSAGFIYEAVQKGYIVGYPDGTFLPKNTVTRAEIARILYSYLGNSLSGEGKGYTGSDFRSDVENVTVSEGCTLSNAEIGGDLYITEGLGSEKVTLSNVDINGALIISGGDVTLENVDAGRVIVGSSMNRLVQVTAAGDTNLAETEVKSTASLKESALSVSAGGFNDLTVNGDTSTTLTLDCDVWDLDMESKSTVSLTSGASVNTLSMKAGGTVSGYGTVGTANITANGANIGMQPGAYTLASGVTATINGKTVKSDTQVVLTPSTFEWDAANSKLENSYDFTFDADPGTLDRVIFEGKTLSEGSDYRITENGFRLYRTFLSTVGEGTYQLELQFGDDTKARLTLKVTDSSKNALAPGEAVFDKYHGAAENDDVVFTLTAASGTQLSGIKISGTNLVRGEDYTYNASTGKVAIKREWLEKRGVGTSTITFTMSAGNNLTAQLTIKDSTPVNALSATEVDFDANTASSDYEDLSVKLKAVDGAKLKAITAVGADKTLEEDWQYTVSSSGEVRISRSAIASLATDGRQYIDLRFSMTSGVNPVLRVNFVTTYQVRVSVTDGDGAAVRDASVIVKPDTSAEDNESATQEQEKLTDSSGIATFYVKKGNYTALVQGEQFENVSKNFRVSSSSQKLSFEVAILEQVSITVTDSFGAKVSGATVTLGNQTQTTGADGTANFTMERGDYPLTVTASGYKTYTETYKVANSIPKRVQMVR